MNKNFIRDGKEIYNPIEVQKIEEVSSFELMQDCKRAMTAMECNDPKANKIIKKVWKKVGVR